jgi:hypothetical protein
VLFRLCRAETLSKCAVLTESNLATFNKREEEEAVDILNLGNFSFAGLVPQRHPSAPLQSSTTPTPNVAGIG